MNRTHRKSGFSLIELLTVIAIIAILAAIIFPVMSAVKNNAKKTQCITNLHSIQSALKMYKLDNGAYPSTEQGLQALVKKPESGEIPRNWKSNGYLERLQKDPWKNDYQYLNPGLHGEIDVFCYGADSQPGGDGVNADIGTWNIDY
jgi:general secretion pathway protein G